MKRVIGFLLLAVLFLACKSDKEKQMERFVKEVEAAGLENFVNIEYSLRGETEVFSYFKGDTLYTAWKYNVLKGSFENYDSLKLKTISANPGEYMEHLRKTMKSLKLESVSQSPWKGRIFKLWLTDVEYVTYVQPGFDLDSPSKVLIKDEIMSSKKISDTWYYKKLKVCRNK